MILEALNLLLLACWAVAVWLVRGLPRLNGKGADEPPRGGLPRVSIVVPVRNQASTIKTCVESLLKLHYPEKEIIVVEGGSSDDTATILKAFGGRIRVIPERPLPAGWIGKNWACQLGAEAASGELLLFTDGDTLHAPESLRAAVGALLRERADMVSLVGRAALRGFWERVILPPVFLLIFLYLGGRRVNHDSHPKALGNGQYLLVRRRAYEVVGGHGAVRSEVVEDVRLAWRLRRAGFKVRAFRAPDLLEVRMYRTFKEIWEGWKKNFHASSDFKPHASLAKLLLIPAFTLTPFALFAYGFLLAAVNLDPYWIAAWGSTALGIWLVAAPFYRGVGCQARYALTFPLGCAVYAAIASASILSGRRVTWKERVYELSSGTAQGEAVEVKSRRGP